MKDIDVIKFADWLGSHYYRVSGWKWRQINDENDKTEYESIYLYSKFKTLLTQTNGMKKI